MLLRRRRRVHRRCLLCRCRRWPRAALGGAAGPRRRGSTVGDHDGGRRPRECRAGAAVHARRASGPAADRGASPRAPSGDGGAAVGRPAPLHGVGAQCAGGRGRVRRAVGLHRRRRRRGRPGGHAVPLERGADGIWTGFAGRFAAHVGRPLHVPGDPRRRRDRWRTDMYSLLQAGSGDVDPHGGRYDGRRPSSTDRRAARSWWTWTTKASGPTSTIRRGPCHDGWRTSSSTSCTSARWAPTPTGRDVRRRPRAAPVPGGPRCQRCRAAADVRVQRKPSLGLRLLPLPRRRDERGRPRRAQALRQGMPSPRIAVLMDVVYNHYDDDSARAAWQYDSRAPDAQRLLLVRGRGATTQPRRRLCRQRLERLGAALPGRPRPRAVRQQRRDAARRVPHRRVPGRPDDLDPRATTACTPTAARCPPPTSSAASCCASCARRCRPSTRHVMLVAEDHSGWDASPSPPRPAGSASTRRGTSTSTTI